MNHLINWLIRRWWSWVHGSKGKRVPSRWSQSITIWKTRGSPRVSNLKRPYGLYTWISFEIHFIFYSNLSLLVVLLSLISSLSNPLRSPPPDPPYTTPRILPHLDSGWTSTGIFILSSGFPRSPPHLHTRVHKMNPTQSLTKKPLLIEEP